MIAKLKVIICFQTNMATVNDRCILNSIFNPNLPLGEFPCDDQDQSTLLPENEEEISTPENDEAKKLELQGVTLAEKGNLDQAIEIFTKAINISPNRAAGYNNRAQAYRLKFNNKEALNDLDRAVELSGGRGNIGGKALCQRGLIKQLEGDKEGALRDYQLAAKTGNELARLMSIQLNPYAALCNQMLADVMHKLHMGQST